MALNIYAKRVASYVSQSKVCVFAHCSWHGSAVLSDTTFLIHGGYNGNNALSDAFIFDIGESPLKSEERGFRLLYPITEVVWVSLLVSVSK